MPLADPFRSLAGHEGRVTAVVFPKAGLFASAGFDGSIRLWDAASGESKQTLAGHAGPVMALSASRDGSLLASAGKDPAIKVWQLGSSDTPKSLSTGGGGNERVNLAVALSPDGKRLAVATQDSPRVQLWEVAEAKQGKQLSPSDLKGDSRQSIFALAFHPEGKLLASVGADRGVRIWDVESGKEAKQIGGIEYTLYPEEGGKEIKRDKKTGGSTQALYAVAISPDGQHLAAAGLERIVRVWNLASGNLEATLAGHDRFVAGLAFSPDSKRLASCDHGGAIQLWDLAAAKSAFTAKLPAFALSLAYSPDAPSLAVAGGDGKVYLISIPA